MFARILTVAIALASTGAMPQQPVEPVRFDADEATTRAEAGRAEIADELGGLPDHEWAGSYYEGDGLGANVSLHLAPGAGFVFEWHGCLGLYGRNYGAVADDGGRVRLEPELANEPGKFGNIEVEFVPVAWGPRRYLIPAAKRREFCNAVMGGSEPRAHPQGRFLLRRGDETKPVSGRPQAAEGDLECLPDRPLQARIVSAGRRRDSIIRVVLDAGREEGVWEGMEFHPLPPEATYETARVTRVFERSSEAEFHPVAHDSFRPRPGWTLSTRRE